MMNPRPESKLLELIKRESRARRLPVRLREGARRVTSRLSAAWAALSAGRGTLTPLQAANRALLAGAAALFCASLWVLAASEPGVPALDPIAQGDGAAGAEAAGERAPAQVTLQQVSGRNLFRPLVAAPPPPKPVPIPVYVPPPPPRIPLSTRAAHLSLVGIVNAGTGMQAVIEDRRNNSTIYASEGQIIGEIRVRTVRPDRVTLAFEDETMDLSL